MRNLLRSAFGIADAVTQTTVALAVLSCSQVRTAVRMISRTVGFQHVGSGDATTTLYVFPWCDRFQMLWITAHQNSTQMVHLMTRWNRTDEGFMRPDVHESHPVPDAHLYVSVRHGFQRRNPAGAGESSIFFDDSILDALFHGDHNSRVPSRLVEAPR